MPPPPIAFGSPPDSHWAVECAQRLSRTESPFQMRVYRGATRSASWAGVVEADGEVLVPPEPTPPVPVDAPARAAARPRRKKISAVAAAAITYRFVVRAP